MASKLQFIFGGLIRSLHSFWLEVMGALFIVIAVMFGSFVVQEYRRYLNGHDVGVVMLVLAATLCLLMLGFGVRSFWRARKLRS